MWDPGLYGRFDAHRLRPGLDLLARLQHLDPGLVVDLGCGSGALTALLAEHWPRAEVIGVDTSGEMLERAPETRVEWVRADLVGWRPPRPADLVFSNAVLHWLDDHDAVFAHMASMLSEGGTMAVQMPDSFSSPAHLAISEVARRGGWRNRLEPLLRSDPVGSPASYHRLLTKLGGRPDVWSTEYLHVLEGKAPVLAWVEGAALRGLLGALDDEEREAFRAELGGLLDERYPPERDGSVLFPFRRLFIVARF